MDRTGGSGGSGCRIHAHSDGPRACRSPSCGREGAQRRSSALEPGLPSWAIGPFTRYAGNPSVSAGRSDAANDWEWPEAFNPSVLVVGGVFHMLYRGAASGNSFSIGAATSTDGPLHRGPGNPVITRAAVGAHGVEDPRMYYLDGHYYAFFTGYNGTVVAQRSRLDGRAALAPARSGHPRHQERRRDRRPTGTSGPDRRLLPHVLRRDRPTLLAKSTDLTHWTTDRGQYRLPCQLRPVRILRRRH